MPEEFTHCHTKIHADAARDRQMGITYASRTALLVGPTFFSLQFMLKNRVIGFCLVIIVFTDDMVGIIAFDHKQ